MKKIILTSICLITGFIVNAQVGIGNTDPKAVLDISASNSASPASNDGVLVPRIAAFPVVNPGVAQNGMMVFKTVASTGFPIGFYYWDNPSTSWKKVDGGNGDYWSLNGNTGTNASTNYLGTNDDNDVIFKRNSLMSGIIGSSSTGFGSESLNALPTGGQNTAYGRRSLYRVTTGASNTAMGFNALQANLTGSSNVGVGYQSLYSTTGSNNVGLGRNTLFTNTSGSSNTAIGTEALYTNLSGDSNTAVGLEALYSNNANNNTAVGRSSLYANSTGTSNSALGFEALNLNNSGSSNVAIGSQALLSNSSGDGNVAIGSYALSSSTIKNNNVAVGKDALRNNDDSANVGVGYSALKTSTTAASNTAIGYNALTATTNGDENTGTGRDALLLNTSGSKNTAYGRGTLDTNTSGDNNTEVGYQADVSAGNLSNAMAIGNGTTVNASNKIRLGNSSVTVIEGQVAYTFPSDARFKYNVKEDVPGLNFITKLKPVTYNFDTEKFAKYVNQGRINEGDTTDYTESKSIIHTGFLAQDVEKICKELGYNFDGLHIPDASNPADNYSVAYSQFIMPIIKAVQEQQSIIETQNLELTQLKATINQLKSEKETLLNLENRIKALENK